jgi:hypothetical protein
MNFQKVQEGSHIKMRAKLKKLPPKEAQALVDSVLHPKLWRMGKSKADFSFP